MTSRKFREISLRRLFVSDIICILKYIYHVSNPARHIFKTGQLRWIPISTSIIFKNIVFLTADNEISNSDFKYLQSLDTIDSHAKFKKKRMEVPDILYEYHYGFLARASVLF